MWLSLFACGIYSSYFPAPIPNLFGLSVKWRSSGSLWKQKYGEVRPWRAGAVQHVALTVLNSEEGPGSYSQVQHLDDPDPIGLLQRIRWDKRAYTYFNMVWIIRPLSGGNNYIGMLQELNVGINKNLKNHTNPWVLGTCGHSFRFFFLSKKQETWTNNIKGMF